MKLITPYTMVISGQTGSGKTSFVSQLIANQVIMHDKPFDKSYCFHDDATYLSFLSFSFLSFVGAGHQGLFEAS